MTNTFKSPNEIRAEFSAAMSKMYKSEVPAYGALVDIVTQINADVLTSENAQKLNFTPGEDTQRITQERHGAIRVGTAAELKMLGRVFSIMGMMPVGYYDLSVASVPVHATAFRPIAREDLAENPFRVFTSLLRLELIEDAELREKARLTLQKRRIFTDRAVELTEQAERDGGLDNMDAHQFVAEVLETFRWHSKACIDPETFEALNASHRLIADIVSFKGPHINHLTPRTLDIDAAQAAMITANLPAKAIVEGPPRRDCPILLRQTAFKALDEAVEFPTDGGGWATGHHTARFGEIEQRGAALTHKGRELYDQLLAEVRSQILPAGDGSNIEAYVETLQAVFKRFPDTWEQLHDEGLAFFKYIPGDNNAVDPEASVEELLASGAVLLSPIVYEDFLPVSAAGIFQSNLGDEARYDHQAASSRTHFEEALGKAVADEFDLYATTQSESLAFCRDHLRHHHKVA